MILRRDATWLSAELLPELVSGRIEGVLGAAPPGATRGKLPVAAPEPETLGEGKQLIILLSSKIFSLNLSIGIIILPISCHLNAVL